MLPVKMKLVRKHFSGFKYFYEGRGELEFTNMQNLESAKFFFADLQVKIAKGILRKPRKVNLYPGRANFNINRPVLVNIM